MRHLLLTAALLCAAPAFARDSRLPLQSGLEPVDHPSRWAAGLMLGDPFGVTLKHYGKNTFDLYFAFVYAPGARFGGDWIFDLGRAIRAPKFDLDVYAGVGPFLGVMRGPCGPGYFYGNCNGDSYVGGRVPFGAEILLKEAPVTFGLEVAPGLGFGPHNWGFLLDGLITLRFVI
jgi:hypothetical protein